jgi:hypothetical protein
VLFASANASIVAESCLFLRNRALSGGVFYMNDVLSMVRFLNSSFSFNVADLNGGAFFIDNFDYLNITRCRFLGNIAKAGGAFYIGNGNNLTLSSSYFANNSAIFDTIEDSCQSIAGAGGAMFITSSLDVLNRNELDLDNVYVSNSAEWFGGAISVLQPNYNISRLFRLGSFFENRAAYGSIFGSPVRFLEMKTKAFEVYQGSEFLISVRFSDEFNQSADMKSCVIQLNIELFNASDSGNQQLLHLTPREFASLEKLFDLDGFYELKTHLKFQQAVPTFPRAESFFNYSLWIEINQFSRTILSNRFNLTVRICPFGHALETHPTLIYKCTPCLAGAFANISEDSPTVCSKCPSGRYSFALSTECLPCEIGKFSSGEGQADNCVLCPPGTYSDANEQSFCQTCLEGTYMDQAGASFCKACPNFSTTLQSRSTEIQNCVCPSGRFGVIPSAEGCRVCPGYRGMKCEANSSIPFVERGFWRNSKESDGSLVYECIPKESCLATEFSRYTNCMEGYQGKRCGECSLNRFRSEKECAVCPQSWISWTIFLVLLGTFLGLYAFMIFGNSLNGSSESFPLRSILISIQSFGVLSRFVDSRSKSATLSTLLSIVDLSNINLEVFFAFDCFVENLGFWNSFTIKVVSLIFVFVFMLSIGYCVSRLKPQTKNLHSANALDKSIAAFLIALTTLYTYVLSTIFSAFRCFPQDDGTFTLLSSPSLDCYDSVWNKYIFVIVVGILIISAVPFILLFILVKNSNRRTNNQFYWRFGRLYEFYKPKYYYWEVIVLIRRTIFVSLVDLTNGWQKLERSFILIAFLVVEFTVDIAIQPHAKSNLPIFEIRTV